MGFGLQKYTYFFDVPKKVYFCSVKVEQQTASSGFVKPLEYSASDDFVILEELPSYGYNSLYRAKRGGRFYILKGLREEHRADPLFFSLLQKEYDLTIGLDHPCIVRLFSIEEVPDVGPCIVMENIDGVTLDKWLESNPAAAMRKRIVLQLLDAMQYYHTHGVVHRDLKPQNIFVTNVLGNKKDSVGVKLIDFGLGDSDEYADFKEPAGTEGYAAPEQWNGDTVDARADIYSFGVILREIFPHRYRSVARRCTAKEPDRRYLSANAVTKAIKGKLWRNVVIIGLIGLISLVGLIGLVGHNKPTPEGILQATETYRLRAELISSQAEAAFVPDSLSCDEEAQQLLAIYTVRYLIAVYEIVGDHPEWSEIEHGAFEDEVSEIITPRINKLGEIIRDMRLPSNPLFFQSERFRILADRYATLEERHRNLLETFGEHNPKKL